MAYKTLGLILAAGKGSRVQNVLENDEPVKAMIKIENGRLIDKSICFLDKNVSEIAVLTFPGVTFESLDMRIKETGLKILKQKTRIRTLPALLELPWLLLNQYHRSADKNYLQKFDSVLTMPCDLVFNNVDIAGMVEFHNAMLKSPQDPQITILSRENTNSGRADLFKIDGNKITGMKKFKGSLPPGYELSQQAGIYIFSKGMLKHPCHALSGFTGIDIYRYLTRGTWTDFGNPDNVLKSRAI